MPYPAVNLLGSSQMKSLIRIAALCILLGGCATSHVLVGTQRPEIAPELVRIYIDPPAQFEKVAILETSSEGSWALTNQQKTNKVIQRLKEEAASLGANGVLIQSIGSAQRGSVVNSFGTATAYGSTAYGTGFAVAAPVMVKEGNALAIYVPDGMAYTQPLPPVATPLAADAAVSSPASPYQPNPPQGPPSPSAVVPGPPTAPCVACAGLLNSYDH